MVRKGVIAAVLVALVALAAPAFAKTGKGQLYLDGDVYGTTVNPSNLPHGGTDPIFAVTNGVDGQLGIAGVGPGDPGYHGGRWAVYRVTFTTAPYLLTSDEDVMQAHMAGDVTVTRDSAADFRCPITKPS